MNTVFRGDRLLTFMQRRLLLPLGLFIINFGIYALCLALIVWSSNGATQAFASIIAGLFVTNLAIIAHDAIHNSFTRVRWLNRVIGTLAFLPALHPYGRWAFHHNHVHHRYTGQIGLDNAYAPMTVAQYRAASGLKRAYYRFLRSLWGQPFYYFLDLWLPKMAWPFSKDAGKCGRWDGFEVALVYGYAAAVIFGLGWARHALHPDLDFFGFSGPVGALLSMALFGLLIPFAVWNLAISLVTVVQHTGPGVRWTLPSGRPSSTAQKLEATVHVGVFKSIDWFFHRVMQHGAHHATPAVPLYHLKHAEAVVQADAAHHLVIVGWSPAYHWDLTRGCKLYDPDAGVWCDFDGNPTTPSHSVKTADAAA